MNEKMNFLKSRADKFFDYGQNAIDKGDYDIAAFNFEQAAQLYIKYTLGLILGDFPKTHNLFQLLEAVDKTSKSNTFKKLVERFPNLIADLEEAYITSRYVPAIFTQKQVNNMKNFVEKLKNLLKTLWT